MTYRQTVKPLFDRLLAAVLTVLLAPLWVIVAIAVRCRMGTPVIFCQNRIGLNDRPFQFCKFRTMTEARDSNKRLLPDDQRLTRLGKFLRSSSLDELPQFWNVFRGDMSLIGPRPLLPQYLPRYSKFQRRRHQVKPGITGLAQVSGRNLLTWNEKFELDVFYVDHLSAMLDLKILIRTFWSVLRKRGINEPGQVSATEFLGDESGGRYEF